MAYRKLILLDLGGVVFQSTGMSNDQIYWDIISRLNTIYGHGLNLGENLFPAFLADYNAQTRQMLTGSEFLIEAVIYKNNEQLKVYLEELAKKPDHPRC